MAKLLVGQRRAANKVICNFPVWHTSIPLEEIKSALREHNIVLLQEDGTEWEGLLLGRDSHCIFHVGRADTMEEYENAGLFLSWYQNDHSSRYEIVSYVS